MLFTPGYIFSILLAIWLLSLIGCIVLGIFCYRLVADRRHLRARLEQVTRLTSGSRSRDVDGDNDPSAAAPLSLPPDPDRETGAP